MAITITRRGNGLGNVSRLLANPAPVLFAGASGIVDNIRLGFRTSRDPWGNAWKKLVVRKGKPLLHTGQLRGSISPRIRGKDSVQVFSGDTPAKSNLHQFGGWTTIGGRRVFVPARPFFPLRGGGRVDLPAHWRADLIADVVAAIRVRL